MVLDVVWTSFFQYFDIFLVDISKEGEDFAIGSVDREHDWEKDALRDNCEDDTTKHHDQEVLLIVECPLKMEVK